MSTLAMMEYITKKREEEIQRAINEKLTSRGRILPGEHLCTVLCDEIPTKETTWSAFFRFPNYGAR